MDKSKLFHCLMVDGMYESFVMESLQNGMIVSSPFLSWYTVVLWMVGGIRLEYGPRKLNIVLTQIRYSATFLNYDLFKVNIISNPSCSCGAIREVPYYTIRVIFLNIYTIEV
jgi:hypothetical protein